MAKKTLTEAQKSAKWKELAESRLGGALNKIHGLAKLANTKRYAYTPKQIETMRNLLEDACNNLFAAYEGKTVAGGKVNLS